MEAVFVFRMGFKVLTQRTIDFGSSYVLGDFCGVSSSLRLRPVVASALTGSPLLLSSHLESLGKMLSSIPMHLFILLGSVCICHVCMHVCVYGCAVSTCADVCACGYSPEGQKSVLGISL